MKDNKDIFWNGDSDKPLADNNAGNIDVNSTVCESAASLREEMLEEKSVFINKYKVYDKYFKEFYLNSLVSPIFIISCIISVIIVSCAIYLNVVSGFDLFWTCAGIIWFIIPIYRIYTYFRAIGISKARLMESYGGEIPTQSYYFLEDCVMNEENKNQRMIYSDITKVILTKNLILLRTKSQLNHIIPRDSFVKGTEKDFLNFMHCKGIKVKGNRNNKGKIDK